MTFLNYWRPLCSVIFAGLLAASSLCDADEQRVSVGEDPFGGSATSVSEDPFGRPTSDPGVDPFGGSADDPFGGETLPTPEKSEIHVTPADAQRPAASGSSVAVVDSNAKPSRAKIEAALRRKASFEFVNVPLSDVASYIQDSFQIPVVIDRRALDDIGVATDVPVTITIQDLSLRSALRLMLDRLDLTYAIRDCVLSITTVEEVADDLEIRLYPVADIMAWRSQPSFVQDQGASPLSPLVDAVETLIQPATWSSVGGSGVVTGLDQWGLLSIAQTGDVHQQIGDLIATIQDVLDSDVMYGTADENLGFNGTSVIVLGSNQRSAYQRIQKALGNEIELEFVDTPLEEVLKYVQDAGDIPVALDHRALDDVGLSGDSPITISVKGIPLWSGLRIMLRHLDLTYLVAQETLQITTPEEAENRPECRVYLVPDLKMPVGSSLSLPTHPNRFSSRAAAGASKPSTRLDALVDLITACIEPASWDDLGGRGSVATLEPQGVMLISNTQQVLGKVDQLIQAIRRARGNGESKASLSVPEEKASEMSVRLYRIQQPAAPIGEIVAAIKGIVAPSSWISAADIFPVGATLVVRQTDEAHRQIDELLHALRSNPGSFPPGMMGTSGGMGGMF